MNRAKRAFAEHRVHEGSRELRNFIREVGERPHGRDRGEGGLSAEDANFLITLARQIIGCV